MILIPAISVKAGQPLRAASRQGQFPADATGCMLTLIEHGVQRVAVRNLDADRGFDDIRSRRAIRGAVNAARDAGIDVDVAAGIRARATVEFWLESGATTVALGPLAVYRPDIAGEVCRSYPTQILLSLDVMGDVVHSPAWIRDAGDATIHLRRFASWPAAGVVRTSLSNARLGGVELEAVARCVRAYPGPLLVRGGAHSVADLPQAAAIGIAAVIVDIGDELANLDIIEAASLFPGRDLSAQMR